MYLWNLLRSAERIANLSNELQDWPIVNSQAYRVSNFELPNITATPAASSHVAEAVTWGLSSSELQRLDQNVSRLAIYLQLFHNYVSNNQQRSAQHQQLDEVIRLVNRCLCQGRKLHTLLFGAISWPAAGFTTSMIVPGRWRSSAQSHQNLRNFLTVHRAAKLFKWIGERLGKLRRNHAFTAGLSARPDGQARP